MTNFKWVIDVSNSNRFSASFNQKYYISLSFRPCKVKTTVYHLYFYILAINQWKLLLEPSTRFESWFHEYQNWEKEVFNINIKKKTVYNMKMEKKI